MKGFNKKIGDVYVLPLPVYTKPLPPLILHNPVSVAMYLWALIVSKNPKQIVHSGCVVSSGSDAGDRSGVCGAGADNSAGASSNINAGAGGIVNSAFASGDGPKSAVSLPRGVCIYDPESAIALWQQGFFGKGTLSRSEPSWFGRTARRMGLDGGELSLEEITEMRRAKRRQFKREREIQQQLELQEKLRKEGKSVAAMTISPRDEPREIPVREEDLAIVRGSTILRLEYLHLHPCEAVFLSLGLGVLHIENTRSDLDLLPEFFRTKAQWFEYIAYHYFRSLGWCARSGVKFGVDWLVYRRGPPFQHAEFAVVVMDSQRPSWAWLHSNMRVVGGAKKTLVLLYVEGPEQLPDFSHIRSVKAFRAELAKYEVKLFTYTRFAPSRNRD